MSMLNNVLIIAVIYTYKHTDQFLETAQVDINHISNFVKNLGKYNCQHKILIDVNKTELLNEIGQLSQKIDDLIEHIIFIYSGHGYNSINNGYVGMIDTENNKINLMTIFEYFDNHQIYCIFGGCREDINDQYIFQRKHNNLITILPCSRGKEGFGDACDGDYLIFSFLEIFKVYFGNFQISKEDLYNILYYTLKFYIKNYNLQPDVIEGNMKMKNLCYLAKMDEIYILNQKIENLNNKLKICDDQMDKLVDKKRKYIDKLDQYRESRTKDIVKQMAIKISLKNRL